MARYWRWVLVLFGFLELAVGGSMHCLYFEALLLSGKGLTVLCKMRIPPAICVKKS